MPVNPKGSCLPCRIVKDNIQKMNKSMTKHVMIYGIIYLTFFELVSLIIRNNVSDYDYKTFWFPLFTQLLCTVVFYNMWLFRNKKLTMCFRKVLIVVLLTIYYFFNFLTILIPTCNSLYSLIVLCMLLGSIYGLMLLTIFENKKT